MRRIFPSKFRSASAAPRRPCRANRFSQLRLSLPQPPSSASGHAVVRRASAPPRPASRAGRRAARHARPASRAPGLPRAAAGLGSQGWAKRALCAVPGAAAVCCRRWRTALPGARKAPSAFAVRRAVRLAAWASGVLGGPPPPDGDGGEDARVAPVQGRRRRAAREGRGRVRRGGVDQGLTLTPIVSRCEL